MNTLIIFALGCELRVYSQWPNISVNDPDPGSGSKNLILNRDYFDWMTLLRIFFFSGSFERKFLGQSTAYYRV